MSTEWDSLIKDLAVLNGKDNKDQKYKDLCASTALTNLWSIVENDLKPKTHNLLRLRELMEEYDPEFYKDCVVSTINLKYQTELIRLREEVDDLKTKLHEKTIPEPSKKPKCSCGLYQTCDICKKFQKR
jgi:hypothetical protein